MYPVTNYAVAGDNEGVCNGVKKIVIIGNSISGHTAAVSLREKDKDGEASITLVTEEPYRFYDRRRLSDFLSGGIVEKDLYLCEESFYPDNRITFLKEKKAASVNPKRKIVYFKDKAALEYDSLILASGCRVVLPDIIGAKKEGVFTMNALDDFKKIREAFLTDQVSVVGSYDETLKIAAALIKKCKVEVKLVSGVNFDTSLVPAGAEVIQGVLTEIIGEGGTQAVKLDSGKIIASSAVLFTDQTEPNIDFLKESGLEIADGLVIVDAQMRTNLEGVFACGPVCALKGQAPKVKNWEDCINDAKILTDALL